MKKHIVICEALDLAAVYEDGVCSDLFLRQGDQLVGDVIWGQVEAVVPGIEAAFVNIGFDRNGFIHTTDLPTIIAPKKASPNPQMRRGAAPPPPPPPPPPGGVRVKDKLLVQIAKAPTGQKGARLTGRLTLPGRFVVLVPDDNRVSISRRVTDGKERERLRTLMLAAKDPGHGLIVRTEAVGRSEDELRADIHHLIESYADILHRIHLVSPPALVYRDSDLVERVLRDYAQGEVAQIVVDSPTAYDKARELLATWNSPLVEAVVLNDGAATLLDRFRLREELEAAILPKVELPSGGTIVIEHTEALTVIDVNSGRSTQSANLAETVLKTNLEAATEIARQFRLRDIGGIVVIDFISMDASSDRNKVLAHFQEALREDKARPFATSFSEHGLVEVSRRRLGQSLHEQLTVAPEEEGQPRKVVSELVPPGTNERYADKAVARRERVEVLKAALLEEGFGEQDLVVAEDLPRHAPLAMALGADLSQSDEGEGDGEGKGRKRRRRRRRRGRGRGEGGAEGAQDFGPEGEEFEEDDDFEAAEAAPAPRQAPRPEPRQGARPEPRRAAPAPAAALDGWVVEEVTLDGFGAIGDPAPRPERSDRGERGDRGGRDRGRERGDRGDRGDRGGRDRDRNARFGREERDRGERNARHDKYNPSLRAAYAGGDAPRVATEASAPPEAPAFSVSAPAPRVRRVERKGAPMAAPLPAAAASPAPAAELKAPAAGRTRSISRRSEVSPAPVAVPAPAPVAAAPAAPVAAPVAKAVAPKAPAAPKARRSTPVVVPTLALPEQLEEAGAPGLFSLKKKAPALKLATSEEAVVEAPAKKAPAKKAAAKAEPSEKAVKAPAKKASAKAEAPASEAVPKKAPAKKAAAKAEVEAPAAKAPAKKAAAKAAPAAKAEVAPKAAAKKAPAAKAKATKA